MISSYKKLKKIFLTIFIFITALSIIFVNTKAATPDGFYKNVLISEGLNLPTKFVEADDGRIFIIEKGGSVKVWENGVLDPNSIVDIEVETEGDRGLLGIVLDPDFSNNGYLYLHYTNLQSYVEISKIKVNADNSLAEGPIVIYKSIGTANRTHAGGGMAFGADGKLYFTIGDGLYRPNAQDLTNSFGKILRINSDGSIPVDNPYVGTEAALDEIWAFGLRNPFSLEYDNVNNIMIVSDVGENAWEEINIVKKAANYGWPETEGDCGSCIFENPLYSYAHNGATASISLGTIYNANQFPGEYYNSLFFADYAQGFIKRLSLDINGNDTTALDVFDFEPQAGTVVDLDESNDGSLMYLTIFPGQLVKLEYQPDNPAPEVKISADKYQGESPLVVNFSSEGTFDPNGDQLDYLWNFADGTTSTEANPVKTFEQIGRYRVQLIVGDGNQSTTSESFYVQVGTAPEINIAYPVEGQKYKAGDNIQYQATAVDANNNLIDQSNIDTKIIFHHLTHIHPFEGPYEGVSNGQFTIPVDGETHPVQWYEIVFTAEDANGLISTKSVNVYAQTSMLNINTNPENLTFYVDSQPYSANYSKELLTGSEIDINTLATQDLNGNYYQFQNWSNAGDIVQKIILADTGINLTANFVQTQSFIAEYYNNMNLEGNPAYSEEVVDINFNWGFASPNQAIQNDKFSARYSKNEFFAAGNYKFTTISDDGVRLLIDGNVVIDEWHDQSAETHEAVVYLEEGSHNIVLEYFENGWFASMKFGYEKVINNEDQKYYAEFYNNKNLEGDPDLIREDDVIDFDWGFGSPNEVINNNNFSARWTKNILFEDAKYEFITASDDGIRLYVDGNLLIDQWNDHGETIHKAEVILSAGLHEVKVEYYENGWDAVAKFNFSKVNDVVPTIDNYVAEYFNNKNLIGQPVLIRNEDTINYNLGLGSPADGVNADNFSSRYTKLAQFEEGNHTFTITSDDGVRLYVGGNLVLDNWNDHGATVDVVNVDLAAGEYEIILEYYENGWDSVLIFDYN